VNGTCHEDVTIDRNGVTLLAANPGVDGIVSHGMDGAAVTVSGARGIVIDGLRLQSVGGGSPVGVFVTRNGEAEIQNALVENNASGIWVNHGGFVMVQNSEILNSAEYGILLTDGGGARVKDSTVEIDNPDRFNSAAIGAFRGITLRLRGDNVIRNKAADGFSIDLVHSVDFRQDDGHTKFIGSMEFANLTNASLRNPEIVGGIAVAGGSRVDIRNSSTVADEVTGGGDLGVFGNSQLSFSRPKITAHVGSINVDQFSSLFLSENVSVTAAGAMRVNGSRFSMAPGSSIAVNGGELAIEDFSVMFANDNTTISADMHFGGSVAKVNLFGMNVNYIGNLFFSSKSSLDFGPNATIEGDIDCGGGDVFFQGTFLVTGNIVGCQSFP